MKVTISTIDEFDRRARQLAKKYKSLKADLKTLRQEILKNPFLGDDLGSGVRKSVWPLPQKARERVAVPAC